MNYSNTLLSLCSLPLFSSIRILKMQSHTGKPANALECTGMGFGVSFLGLKANLTSSNKLLLLNKESKCKQYPTWRSFPLWEGELAFILTLQRPAAKISCYVDRSCRPTDNRVFIAWKKISEWIMRDTELENYVLYEFSSSCADFFFPFFFPLTPKIDVNICISICGTDIWSSCIRMHPTLLVTPNSFY